VHLGNIEAAKESFARLKLVPNLSPRILNLWLLYASTLGAADASPAPPSAARSLGAIAALPDDGTTISAARTPEAPRWAEGTQYVAVPHPRPISLPGQEILVTEFFSYASMASNQFQPLIHQLVQSLPPNAVVDHVPVSLNPSNVWAMFQLAYVTAQTLGVGDEIHDATFGAVWSTDELAISERSGAARSRMPTLEDAALFYQKKAGVPLAQFLQASKSFSVASRLRHDESLLLDYGIDRIPTIVVNGKYRVTVQSAGSPERMIELVDWLVAKESGTSTQAQTVSAETAGL
jgi:protein dithiol oxidoreductase (disulfide-forming)